MEIEPHEKTEMISVLKVLHLNTVEDLIEKLKTAKNILTDDKYQLMVNGNSFIYGQESEIPNKEQYRKITLLEGRWCLKSILFYHMTRTKKISSQEYTQLMSFL